MAPRCPPCGGHPPQRGPHWTFRLGWGSTAGMSQLPPYLYSYHSRQHCVIGPVKMDRNWPSHWPWLPWGRAVPGTGAGLGGADASEETAVRSRRGWRCLHHCTLAATPTTSTSTVGALPPPFPGLEEK